MFPNSLKYYGQYLFYWTHKRQTFFYRFNASFFFVIFILNVHTQIVYDRRTQGMFNFELVLKFKPILTQDKIIFIFFMHKNYRALGDKSVSTLKITFSSIVFLVFFG